MTKQPKRRLAFRTEHQGNPLSHARLTDSDLSNGVFVTIELDGKICTLSPSSRQMSFVRMRLFEYRRMDVNGDTRLRYKPNTFTSFENFLEYLNLIWNEPGVGPLVSYRTDEGEPLTEDHDRVVKLLLYAALPVWAKDEAAYRKRWPHDQDRHPFERGTDYGRQRTTAAEHQAYRENRRRAA